MSQDGWIKLHRSIFNWEWYTNPIVARVFIHILLNAKPEDSMVKMTLVKRGEYMASRRQLSIETGLSGQNVRTAIQKLQATNDITCGPVGLRTIYAVVNYDKYQD